MADGRINKDDVIDPALQKEIDNITASLKKMADQLGTVIIETSKLNTANSEGISSTQKRKQATDELSKSERLIADYNEKIAKTYQTLSDAERQQLLLKEQARRASAELTKQIKAEVDAMEGGKKSTNTWGNAITSFQAKFNAVGNVMANVFLSAIRSVSDAFMEGAKAVIEFDKKARELQTITGSGAIGMIEMTSAAVKMSLGFGQSGIKVNQSATDILEAFKLVASAKPELLNNAAALQTVTEQALILAKAAGTDTATAVTSLTKIMNQFGAPAEEAGRYINVLAAGAKFGAGEIPYLSDAVGRVGVVAKTANQPIEELSAAMELFAEKGIESEKAGTAYRNILIKSMNDQSNYKDGVFSTSLMMENLAKVQNDTTLLTKKFGLENVVVAQTLAQGKSRIDELTKSMTGTNTAYEQAENNTKTLSDSWQYLKQGISAIVLGISQSAGVIKDLIDWFGKLAASMGMAMQVPVSEKLREEQQEMNVLAGAIMSSNEGSKVRLGLMTELQQKYPDYFGNLDKEKAKNEDIQKALEAVNAEYRKKIQYAIIEEDVVKISKQLKDNLTDQRNIAKGVDEAYQNQFKSLGGSLTTTQKIYRLMKDTQSATEQALTGQTSTGKLNTAVLNTWIEKLRTLRTDESEYTKQINALLKEQTTIQITGKTDVKKVDDDKTKKEKSNLQEIIDAQERRKRNELGMLEAAVLNAEEGSKIQLDAKLKLYAAQEKYELMSTAKIKDEQIVYESKTAGEKEKIIAEFNKKRFDDETAYDSKIKASNAKVYDERIKNIGTSLDKLSSATKEESDNIIGLANEEIKRYRSVVKSADISNEEKKKLTEELNKYEEKIAADREKRAEHEASKIIQEAQREAKEKLEAAKGRETAGGGEITDEEALGLQRFLSAEEEKINALNINADKKKELIDKLKDIEKAADDEIAANNKKNLDDEVKEAEKAEADKIKAKKATEQAAGEFVRSALDFVKSGYEEESQKYETEKNYQLSVLEKQKESGSITEKQYQDKKTKIENDAAIKQAKVKRKAAEMDKVIALSGVVQHTAVALMKAAELGPIFGPIYAAIVVATAALQTASIIKQPLPEIPKFKEGTKAPLGKSTLAWVGDGNERELITHPDGSMMLSPDRATLSFLPKGATVTPLHRLNKQMRGIEQQMLIVKEVEGWQRIEKAINKMANSIPGQSTTFVNVTGENLHVTNRYRR